MNHPTEEQLIAYRDGEADGRDGIAAHVKDCGGCRAELERIEAVLRALSDFPVPDPGEDYERRVWQKLAPKLPEKRARWWEMWLEPRRLVTVGALATVVLGAFVLGRMTKRPEAAVPMASTEQVRERILVVAVGEHLGRSEMMLVELANAEPQEGKKKLVNISAEQRRAGDLLEENRLYRQTAMQQGDAALASVLDELERVLVDVAHSPGEITPAQLESIQKRIEARGLLFKVRVVGQDLQKRQEKAKPVPEKKSSVARERNKA
jgi:hypothetical protein